MSTPTLQQLNLLHASICQALADPKRILILYTLAEQAMHVTALAEQLGMPQPTVSRHLRVLRQESLVQTERDGNVVTYALADCRIIDALNIIQEVMVDALKRHSRLVTA